MNDPWWAAQAPTGSGLLCGPNQHRLRWEAGELQTPDHPDSEGEAVLEGLGGDQPACLAVASHWREHAADPRILTIGARHPGEALTASAEDLDGARHGAEDLHRRGHRPARTWFVSGPAEQFALLRLFSLAAPLQRRLQHEVAANLTVLADDPSILTVLEAATLGRLRPVLRRWRPGLTWDVALGEPGIRLGPVVTVTVAPTWLADVWGPYLAVVDGCLVLEVREAGPTSATVTVVRSPTDHPAPARLAGPAPWRVVEY